MLSQYKVVLYKLANAFVSTQGSCNEAGNVQQCENKLTYDDTERQVT